MHFSPASLLAVAGLAAQASAHGLVRTPATRQPGTATEAACGRTMVRFYTDDATSYPEALLRANPRGLTDGYDAAKCNLWLCKGYQFGDNEANVQSYKPGDVVDMEVFIRIPHRGHANVSVVDTASNTVIGTPLKAWAENYAASANPPADQTKFSVTVPELEGKCTEPGACVIQWYWFGQGQTYESCIDFTIPAATEAPARRMRGRSWA
ncbi:Chitin-binding, domain 3 [Madurella fahalii]|uniref:Chitin-binding, domain 3 n=1 Tax=Madurella fahalii TaxID=1157608 RepID=A0ABQ0G7I0_9PEZI